MSTQTKKIKDMTMLELKEYLQARGVTVTGYLKPALVDALDYFNDSPPFELYDIFNHLIYHTTDYDKQQTIWWFGQSLVCLLLKCHSMKIL